MTNEVSKKYHRLGSGQTPHKQNRMQMSKTLCSPSLSFISIRFVSCKVRRLTPALGLTDIRIYCDLILSIQLLLDHLLIDQLLLHIFSFNF